MPVQCWVAWRCGGMVVWHGGMVWCDGAVPCPAGEYPCHVYKASSRLCPAGEYWRWPVARCAQPRCVVRASCGHASVDTLCPGPGAYPHAAVPVPTCPFPPLIVLLQALPPLPTSPGVPTVDTSLPAWSARRVSQEVGQDTEAEQAALQEPRGLVSMLHEPVLVPMLLGHAPGAPYGNAAQSIQASMEALYEIKLRLEAVGKKR